MTSMLNSDIYFLDFPFLLFPSLWPATQWPHHSHRKWTITTAIKTLPANSNWSKKFV